ncbi:MAG: isoprenylcysteine carboxylmethyltransferase family protein [Bacteroidetes bacterium]|nr:isoprenylcysteine carboxylmethyltransferase family protein [Bacteroidota bacterium]
MSLVFDTVIIVFLYVMFGLSHTVLASRNLKRKIAESLGDKIAFYRLFYNVSSMIFLLALYEVAPKPDVIIYDLDYPYDIIILGLQIFALIGFVWTLKYFDGNEFLGINQVRRYFNDSYNVADLDEQSQLVTNGAYKICRHPIYFFSILILGLRPTMDFFYLVSFICITIYFYAGSIFEERKLEQVFGVRYSNYKKDVSGIIPVKLFFKRKP